MRAREFTINVPITIKINGDEDPEIDMDQTDSSELDDNPVMIPPLQQDLELKKAAVGNPGPVVQDIVQPDEQSDILDKVAKLLSR